MRNDGRTRGPPVPSSSQLTRIGVQVRGATAGIFADRLDGEASCTSPSLGHQSMSDFGALGVELALLAERTTQTAPPRTTATDAPFSSKPGSARMPDHESRRLAAELLLSISCIGDTCSDTGRGCKRSDPLNLLGFFVKIPLVLPKIPLGYLVV